MLVPILLSIDLPGKVASLLRWYYSTVRKVSVEGATRLACHELHEAPLYVQLDVVVSTGSMLHGEPTFWDAPGY